MILTKDHIIHILHGNADAAAWADAALEVLPKYEINTPNRIAGFFAQCGHESMNFTALSENLNYRAETLEKLFSKYFSKAGRNAADYAKQPEKIANVIYANRMGNGDTASGDGFKFRGRGVIQLTGRDNYSAFALSIKMTLPDVIDHVQTKKGALESACWYWNSRKINLACDENDIVKMTKLVNGGTIGLEDRRSHYEKALAVLGGAVPAPITNAAAIPGVLKKGSTGEAVKRMQAELGLEDDGVFGPGTEAAVKKWQAANGLAADGIAGPKTLAKLLN
jgi:putative chitinase